MIQKCKDLHKTLCKTIIILLKDSMKESGITEEEIKAARDFANLKPNTISAIELLEFLDSDAVKEAIITRVLSLK